MTKTLSQRSLGRTGVTVTEVGFGGAHLGQLFERVPDDQAQATLAAAWEGGMRLYDTAPYYGYGLSEHRTGDFLRRRERSRFVLSTKVGRVFKAVRDLERFDPGVWSGGLPFEFHYDYTYDGVMRSWEDSLLRLGLPSVDLLLVHDLDSLVQTTEKRLSAHEGQLYASGARALEELRRDGRIGAIGAGINVRAAIPRLLDLVDLDFFIVAMPYTLLDQDVLDAEFPLCQERGVSVVIGAPFASGILVTGPKEGAVYAYGPAPPEILEKAGRIQAVCERHEVPLPAAAIQFPLAHPLVSAVIPGAVHPGQVRSNLDSWSRPIPAELWAELKSEGLIRADAPTP